MSIQAQAGLGARRPRTLPVGRGWLRGADAQVLLVAGLLTSTIVVGTSSGIAPVATVGSFVTIVTALISPAIGLAVLAFTATLQPPAGLPAPGFVTILVGATVLGCVYRLPIERPRPRANVALLLLGAFVLYVTVQQLPEMASGYAGKHAHDVGYLYFQVLTGFGLVIAAIWVLHARSAVPVVAMGLAGATAAALVAVVPYVAPGLAGLVANLAGPTDDATRASGTFSNPNFMGASAAMALVAAAAGLSLVRTRRDRALLLFAGILLAGAVALSLSRGALLTAFIGVAWVVLLRSPRAAVGIMALGVVGALVIYPAFVEWRLVSLTGSASATAFALMAQSDEGRLAGVLGFVPLFLTSPIVGVGFGQYLISNIAINQVGVGAHNWYSNVLAEQGLVGFSIWMLFMAAVVLDLRRRPKGPRVLGTSIMAAFSAACLFLEVPTSFQTVALPSLFLVAALASDSQADQADGAGGLRMDAMNREPGPVRG